jgi:hypothetical protein
MSTLRIRHAVWLYARFTLSYRDVEELLAERGLDISYETIRRWELKFGLLFARRSVFRAMIDSRTGNGAIDDAEQDAPLGPNQSVVLEETDETFDQLADRRRNEAQTIAVT